MSADKVREILENASKQGHKSLSLNECREIFELSGISMNKSIFVKSIDEAKEKGSKVGYPLVMKVVSPQVVHKTDAGGVKIGIRNETELADAYDEMMTSVKSHHPDADILGVTLDEMVSGTELIIGGTIDNDFGRIIMFGIGGIFVEVYKDVTFRLIPLTKEDALEMLEEIKGKGIYQGARNLPKADPEGLAEIICSVAKLFDNQPLMEELDVNPLVVTKDGLVAIDARIIIRLS